MKIIPLIERESTIRGTTCANCDFTQGQARKRVKKEDLNEQGGTIPEDKYQTAGMKKADVITMPGHKFPQDKLWCSQPEVKQWVTERMCCDRWNHPDLILPKLEEEREE